MDSVASFVGLVVVALLLERATQKSRLPFSIILVITGFVGSELITRLGFDTGLTWQSFQQIILHVLVPVLVFESAYKLPFKALLPNLPVILTLAIPGMLLAALITGAGLYFGIGHPEYFPFTAAILAGVIASATDPVAVISIFTKLGVPHRLTTLLEGESLLNDATAVVAYSVTLALALMPENSFDPNQASQQFLLTLGGGIAIGAITGLAGALGGKICINRIQLTIITISAGVIAFWLAEHIAHVSGIVAVLSAGMILGEAHRQRHPEHKQTLETAELTAWIANAIVFLLVGVSITLEMFASQWLTMLIAIAAAMLARLVLIYGLVPVVSGLRLATPVPMAWRHIMFWGGLRGGVSLALVLSIPIELEAWYVIQAAVYGVVLFSLLVQATTAEPLIRRLLK